MAIAWGQAAFAKYGRGAPLDVDEPWYNHPTSELLGRLLWLQVDAIYLSDKAFYESFIQCAGENCALIQNILLITSITTRLSDWRQ